MIYQTIFDKLCKAPSRALMSHNIKIICRGFWDPFQLLLIIPIGVHRNPQLTLMGSALDPTQENTLKYLFPMIQERYNMIIP